MDKYIKTSCILLAVGHCGSGKTVAMQYTIRTLNAFDFIVVLSNTAQFNRDYDFLKDMGLDHRIYNGSQCDKVFKLIMRIQEFSTEKKRVCIICDDILGSLTNSKTFLKLASTYRHFNISLFLTSQYVSAQSTIIRELANYVYIYESRTDSSRKAIYQSYFGDCGTFIEFKKLISGLKAYQFFFIDRPGKRRFKMIVPFNAVPKPRENPQESKKNEKIEKNVKIPRNIMKHMKFTEIPENEEEHEEQYTFAEKSDFTSKFY